MYKNELEIDVFRCLRALLKNWMFIAFISVLFLLAGIGLTLNKDDDRYSATATVYASAENSYSEAANAVTAMNAYMDVAKSYKVCQRASLILGRSDVDVADVQGSVYVSSSAESGSSLTSLAKANSATVISFTATTIDPDLSMEMADAMAQAYTIEMNNILHLDLVKILDNAYNANKTHSALKATWKKRINIMIVGFALACVAVVLFEILDNKVRTVREATIRDNLPILGIIPDYKE